MRCDNCGTREARVRQISRYIILGIIGVIVTIVMTVIFWPKLMQMQQQMAQKSG